MKTYKIILILLLFSALSLAKNFLDQADMYYQKGDYFLALQNYQSYHPRKEDEYKIKLKIARCYYNLNKMDEAYKTYYDYSDSLQDMDIYMYATALNKIGNYKEAIKWYYNVPKTIADSLNIKEKINSCRWSTKADSTIPIELKATRLADLGQSFGIQYYKNGVVFSYPEGGKNPNKVDNHGMDFQALFYSDIKDNQILPTQKKFSSNLVFPYHVGAISFANNYAKIFYTRTILLKHNKSVLKIYSAEYDKKANEWKNETELPFNSDSYSCAHPAVSPDNRYLYFASDMPGGLGGKDIYKVKILAHNKYGKATNLGEPINTPGDEMFPFISLDNTLYFSSNGHVGFGGLDVFRSKPINDGWGSVENMMQPINSSFDDFAYIINPNDKKTGFVSSDRENKTDIIYSINLAKKPPLKLSSVIENATEGFPVENGKISLVDVNTGNEIGQTTSDKYGAFQIPIPNQFRDNNQPLSINITQPDYEPRVINIPASKIQDINTRRIPLEPKHQYFAESFSSNIVDIYDGSVIAGQTVILKDKKTNDLIGQAVSGTSGDFEISIPAKYQKSTQEFKVKIPQTKGYKEDSLTLSIAELDYIKKKGIELKPSNRPLPATFTSKLISDADNLPIANATIMLKDVKTGETVGKATTGKDGSFNIPIAAKYKKENNVFEIETKSNPNYVDRKITTAIYNLDKMKEEGIRLKDKEDKTLKIASTLTTTYNGYPITKASIRVTDAQTGTVLGETTSKDDGSFELNISDIYKGGKEFVIEIKKGTEFQLKKMVSSAEDVDNIRRDGIPLTPIFNNDVLNDINKLSIPHDRKVITAKGYDALDKLAYLLKQNPDIIIKLNGQTDIRGERIENLNLSQQMAETAKQYLVSKGIPASNIIARGYGDRYLINKCHRGVECSLTEHIVNNRIEVVVWHSK
ncbi:MAG: OmpA family protein [Paludibacteraceae bacterium]|nr:OmpA family protein [Paludibacteraceae bacterium]